MLLLKRFFDIVLSVMAILLLLPLMVIVGIIIKLESKGPIIFKQKRLTLNGKLFIMYKFRSMIENAENVGTGLFNYKNDFRVTKTGLFLRKSSLDELPQLFNVFKGDMSIVGPRPPVSYELGDYCNLNDDYKRRFKVLPGITGLAQIKGRNELEWDEKVVYDNQYIELFKKYGIFIDIKIIFLTVVNTFAMKNIYESKNKEHNDLNDEDIAREKNNDIIVKASSDNNKRG